MVGNKSSHLFKDPRLNKFIMFDKVGREDLKTFAGST
jgi:hypothetical protein